MPTAGYHKFLLNWQFYLANQMNSSSQGVKGRYGMQTVKLVNNDTIKHDVKYGSKMDITSLPCLCCLHVPLLHLIEEVTSHEAL